MRCSYRILVALGILLFPLLASYGCGAKPPEEEPKLAQQAMDEAKKLQADKITPMDWGNAMQRFKDAELMVKQRRYGDAKTFFLQAKSRFENAAKSATLKREGYSREIDEARTLIGSNYAKITAMLSGSRVPARLKKEIEPAVNELNTSMAELDKAVSDGDIVTAMLKVKDVQDKSFRTLARLETGK